MEPTPNEWKTRTLLLGGFLGALAGVAAAFFFIRSSESAGVGRPSVQPKAALQAGIGVMGVLKQIASLAEE
ncbi:MAG TPA: hypothetical protein VII92_12790 [Anaerolineae bacterium]